MQELENYNKEKLTIDLVWANVFGILILIPVALIFGLPFYLLWHPKMEIKDFFENLFLQNSALGGLSVFVILISGIIVHELIHGIVWSRFAKDGFNSIKFGVLWKMLTPYCHCKEPLTVRQYIWGAIAPAILLGFIPSVLALGTGSFGMLVFGMLFTIVAAGDFLIINLIRKENKNDLVQDHPSEAGCYIYRKTEDKKTQDNL
jgi:hypothetical protein